MGGKSWISVLKVIPSPPLSLINGRTWQVEVQDSAFGKEARERINVRRHVIISGPTG